METLMHADIFFFISSIGFIVLFALLIIALWHLISLCKTLVRIAKRVEAGVDTVAEETKELIGDLRESHVFSFLFGKRKKKRT